jgi:hypothetical protein
MFPVLNQVQINILYEAVVAGGLDYIINESSTNL